MFLLDFAVTIAIRKLQKLSTLRANPICVFDCVGLLLATNPRSYDVFVGIRRCNCNATITKRTRCTRTQSEVVYNMFSDLVTASEWKRNEIGSENETEHENALNIETETTCKLKTKWAPKTNTNPTTNTTTFLLCVFCCVNRCV